MPVQLPNYQTYDTNPSRSLPGVSPKDPYPASNLTSLGYHPNGMFTGGLGISATKNHPLGQYQAYATMTPEQLPMLTPAMRALHDARVAYVQDPANAYQDLMHPTGSGPISPNSPVGGPTGPTTQPPTTSPTVTPPTTTPTTLTNPGSPQQTPGTPDLFSAWMQQQGGFPYMGQQNQGYNPAQSGYNPAAMPNYTMDTPF